MLVKAKPSKSTSRKTTETQTEDTQSLPLATKKSSPCCLGNEPCLTTSLFSSSKTAKTAKTKITVKYDVGFHNQLFIRGKGANLSWEKGLLLKNVKSDEWVFETEEPFSNAEFKVLINDKHYENGENHQLKAGAILNYTPSF